MKMLILCKLIKSFCPRWLSNVYCIINYTLFLSNHAVDFISGVFFYPPYKGAILEKAVMVSKPNYRH